MASSLCRLQESSYELLARLEADSDEDEKDAVIRDFLQEDNLQMPGYELPELGRDWTWFNVDR